MNDEHVQDKIDEVLASVPIHEYGRWVYFPWSGEMIHLLPPDEFRELRLNRNRNKITRAEQEKLAQVTIGIVGLSVGNAVAIALAIEGLGGCLKLADFFLGTHPLDPPLDMVIDECDGIRIKFLLREKARQLSLPVLMETSDRGMLDVERFDLEPNRPLFHGLLGDTTSDDTPYSMTNEEKVRFVGPIVGLETISDRMGASMLEIGESIS